MLSFIKRLFVEKPVYKKMGQDKTISTEFLDLNTSIQIRQPNKKERLIRDLNKKATALKKTNINESIKCLEQIFPLLDQVATQYPIATYLRLPLFLQQAARMDEADELFSTLYQSRKNAADLKVIKDKWGLAKKRENKRLSNS